MVAVRALREKLGEDAIAGLHIVVSDAGRQWKDEVLTIAGERFEKRLAEEIGTLRVDIAREFASVRVEMAKEFATMRAELHVGLADTRATVVKWCFVFWIGQLAAVSAIFALLRS